MTIELVNYSDIGVERWDDYCLNSDSAWFVHTSGWLDYTLNMRFEKNSINHSFAVLENNKITALVPLVEENIYGKDYREIGFAGFNNPYPAFDNNIGEKNRKKIEKIIFEKVKDIKVDYISFYLCPLTDDITGNAMVLNPLNRFGFNDVSISTNILCLNESEETLFRNIGEGHKRNIKTAVKKGFSVEIIDVDNYDQDKFEIYKNLHFTAAGRKTRSDETWVIMSDWIKSGVSILALLQIDSQYVAAAFVNTYKKKAYYQSGAILPAVNKEKGGHIIHWEIIKFLKKKGYSYYETGWNWYPNISQEVADDKMLNISRFKAGFGADIYPLYRGEYFINEEYMRDVLNSRLEKYLMLRTKYQGSR